LSIAKPMPASADDGFRCSLNPSYRAAELNHLTASEH
jgi:hypothetical protein